MSPTNFGPAYRIKTERLLIRCWEPSDAVLYKTAVDENIQHLKPWLYWAGKEPEELEKKVQLLRKFRGEFDLDVDFYYGIFDQEETYVVGGTGLHTRAGPESRQIGYWIHKRFTNQGYATEISSALAKVAFEIERADRVEIFVHPDNLFSAAIPRKIGFSHEATLRERLRLSDGKFADAMVWTMFKSDYPASIAAKTDIEAYNAFGIRIL